jgi:hypothetical protein
MKQKRNNMKLKTKIIAGAAVLASLTFAATGLQAQVTVPFTITATASVQGSSTNNGTVTTYAAPTSMTLDTKQILADLAKDEFAAGIWSSSTFPGGAKLVVIINGGDFQVLDKAGNFLVDVTNILSVTYGGIDGNFITSGKQNDNTGLSSPTITVSNIATFSYDDTNIIGSVGLQFYLTGIVTGKTTDTTPNTNTGVYTETKSFKWSNTAGEGNYQSRELLLTGSLTGSGKGTLTLP